MEEERNDIEVKSSVLEFFYEQVKHAIKKQRVCLSEMSEWYAVNLLSEYTRPHPSDEPAFDLERLPVGIIYFRLSRQSLPERLKGFKAIGDSTLFVSGFFSDSLTRSLVDVDYYMGFGMNSYDALAHIYDSEYWDRDKKELFSDLTTNFRVLVDVLADVRDSTDIESTGGLLRLYEKWIKTRSPRDQQMLQTQGVIPNSTLNLTTVH
ncbi:MAG: hypothetical protein V1736_04445 [Pseudomonadota bacterium]